LHFSAVGEGADIRPLLDKASKDSQSVLKYLDLDDRTRQLMVQEIDQDIESGSLYLSPRLTDIGKSDYPFLLREAAKRHSDGWLEAELRKTGRMKETNQRTTLDEQKIAKVPLESAQILAEGEFNRFYIRALALRTIADGVLQLQIYRAKAIDNPPPELEKRIGQSIGPRSLLRDLRKNRCVDRVLGLPNSFNAGLSARLPTN
jgi:hypothetical protein